MPYRAGYGENNARTDVGGLQQGYFPRHGSPPVTRLGGMDAHGRSLRTRWAGALVALVAVGAVGGLSGCGSDSLDYRDSPDVTVLQEEKVRALPESPGGAAEAVGEVREDVITTGHATVRTGEPAAAAADFTREVQDRGGRIEYSETSTYSGQIRSTLTARVPAREFDAVLALLDGHGEVVARSTQSTDVGQERVDLEARKKALQASIDRLTDLMGNAASVEELLQAEEMLTQRQADLDSLSAQLEHLSDQVALSTLEVTFTVDDEGYRPPNVFERAWSVFLESLEVLLFAVVGLLPWLVVLGAVLAAVIAFVRRLRRGRRRGESDRSNGRNGDVPEA